MVQKSKLIHILINLIANAKDAINDVHAKDKILTISIECDTKAVFLKMSDNGHGIATDQLEKIFSYGFTTKAGSHGFGLHGSANYMTEMNGQLWAESEGQGKGATFILKFPLTDSVR